MLDIEDQFARCLMREGDALPHGITETKRLFTIDWDADYTIVDDTFTWVARETGRTTIVNGYPTRMIMQMSSDVGMRD